MTGWWYPFAFIVTFALVCVASGRVGRYIAHRDSRGVDDVTHYDGEHPFARPVESDASMFIQWKGTVVCLDFQCSCGENGHYDGDFAYYVRCPTCGSVYELGTQVVAKRLASTPDLILERAVTLDTEKWTGTRG